MNAYRASCCLWIVLLASWWATAHPVHAQTPPESGETWLPPVEVTATRSPKSPHDIPAAVSVVEAEDIQQGQPTLTLDESLYILPGLLAHNPYNFAQDLRISLRGFGARSPFGIRGIKILIDDIPQTLPDGTSQLDTVDPGIIQQIEVLRGPSASLYGNASGGVVSLRTENGPASPFEMEPRFVTGAFGLLKTQIKLGGRHSAYDYRVFGSRLEFNGYREHSVTENRLLQSKLTWHRPSGTHLQWSTRVFHSPRAEDPGGLTAVQAAVNPRQAQSRNRLFDAGEEVAQQMMGLRWQQPLGKGQELTLITHIIHRDFSNRLPFVAGGQVTFQRWAPGVGLKYLNRHSLFGKSNRVLAGIDWAYLDDDRRRFNNNFGNRGAETLNQRETVDNIGVYLRDEWTLADHWELTIGGRYDRVHYRVDDRFGADGDQTGSKTLSQGSGTLGVMYHLTEKHHLYWNAATVFETPTTTELINNPSGAGGFNPGLQPQTSYSVELGVKGDLGAEYELAVFYIRTRDEITPFELAAFPGRTFFRNSGRSGRLGAEAWLKWGFLKYGQVTASYTFSDFEFREFNLGALSLKGNRLPGIPVHRVAMQVRYQHPLGMFARLQVEHAGPIFVNNENTAKNEANTISRLEVGVKRRWHSVQATLFTGINNVLDEAYNANIRINAAFDRYFEPAPPLNWFAGISLRWTPWP